MEIPIVQFILIALACAVGLWAISQFPADAVIVKIIRVVVVVVLVVVAVNIVLILLLGHPTSFYLNR